MEIIQNKINNNTLEQSQSNVFQIKDNNLINQNQPELKEIDKKYSFNLKKDELKYDKMNKDEQNKFEILQTLLNGQHETLKLNFQENIKRIEADIESEKIKNKKKIRKN